MKDKKLITLIVSIVVIILIAGGIIWYINWGGILDLNQNNMKAENVQVLEDGTRINISDTIKNKVLELEELKITNIKIEEKEGIIYVRVEAENFGEMPTIEEMKQLVLTNKKGEVLKKIDIYISEIAQGTKTEISANIPKDENLDILNAYDIFIEGENLE